jgi:hypothetical protein
MKTYLICGVITLLAGSLVAAESSPKDEVAAAAKKLADQSGYSWTATVTVPEDAPFHPGPTEGKTEKDGMTLVKLSFGDNTTEFVLQGDKAAVTDPDGAWQAVSELDTSEGPGRFLSVIIRNFKSPATQVAELAGFAKDLKQDGEVYSGDLTEEGAKTVMRFRRSGGPAISNAKGSVKFWIKDGAITKYQYKVTGLMSFNGNDMDVDRTTTVEIKDVGKTKVDVPEAAKKKLQ